MYRYIITTLAIVVLVTTVQSQTLPEPPTASPHVAYTAGARQHFVQMSGSMQVPNMIPPRSGYQYLWPGLFLPKYGGVLQPVLSSGRGHWTINNTWYYNITQDPAGAQHVENYGFDVDPGETIRFDMRKEDSWSSTISVPGTEKSATHFFPMIDADKANNIPYATFEAEMWHQTWDFPLAFNDLTMVTSGGTDSSWCNDKPYAADGAAFTVDGINRSGTADGVNCTIKSLTLRNATATPTANSSDQSGQPIQTGQAVQFTQPAQSAATISNLSCILGFVYGTFLVTLMTFH